MIEPQSMTQVEFNRYWRRVAWRLIFGLTPHLVGRWVCMVLLVALACRVHWLLGVFAAVEFFALEVMTLDFLATQYQRFRHYKGLAVVWIRNKE